MEFSGDDKGEGNTEHVEWTKVTRESGRRLTLQCSVIKGECDDPGKDRLVGRVHRNLQRGDTMNQNVTVGGGGGGNQRKRSRQPPLKHFRQSRSFL